MKNSIIDDRLKAYQPQTLEDEQDALKEILQEIILYGLSTTDFFRHGVFHGGTSLRILYGLPRFSEDLDFQLKLPNPTFRWQPYLDMIVHTCEEFGIKPEVVDRSSADKTVQKMFLKDNSIGKLLNLTFHHHPGKKLMIKLESDTNPPAGSKEEIQFLPFPVDYSIVTQDMPSNFAGKCHALLCREYIKGRDWYDFIWYVKQQVKPNTELLTNAIKQQGPWAGQGIKVNDSWLADALNNKITSIDWQHAADEVRPFLRTPELKSLDLWGNDFFLSQVSKLC